MRLDRVDVALYGVIAALLGGLVGNPRSPVAWTLWSVGALLIGFALWPRRRTQHPPEDPP